MTLLIQARENRLKALENLEARQSNIFAITSHRHERPVYYTEAHAA